jgi:hypothetical protein
MTGVTISELLFGSAILTVIKMLSELIILAIDRQNIDHTIG